VLVPLKDVAPDVRIDGASIDEMLSRLDASDVQPLAGP
jgi:2-amino-4-hydroxy-6-hydroxymethyldihydropteridine diphosphokinase